MLMHIYKVSINTFFKTIIKFIAHLAAASTCNVILMRNNELSEGIEVYDKNEKVIGTSKIAAKKVCIELYCKSDPMIFPLL